MDFAGGRIDRRHRRGGADPIVMSPGTLASCPTGLRSETELRVEVAQLAVQSTFDPMFEIVDGEHSVVQ
jgi:hypothetical protein